MVIGPLVAIHLPFADNLNPALPCALGHSHGHIGWVNIAIRRMIQRAFQVLGADQRPAFLDLLRCQEFILDPHAIGRGRIEPIFIHPLIGLGHAQVANHRKPCIQAGLGFQLFIELHRIIMDMRSRVTHIKQR